MDRTNLIILIIIGLILFVLGGGAGIVFQKQADSAYSQKAALTNALDSKVVPSIVAHGQVKKVDGQYLTLSYDGESITVKIKEGAKIYFFDSSNKIAPQDVNLTDIKIGDYLDVIVKINSNGELEGSNVAIIM